MIASVKLPSDDAQIDASRYDSDKGGVLSTIVVFYYLELIVFMQGKAFYSHCAIGMYSIRYIYDVDGFVT